MKKKKTRKLATNSKQSIEKMKYEIANELGVTMGPNASAKANGSVGGEITKRLVKMAENQMSSSNRQTK